MADSDDWGKDYFHIVELSVSVIVVTMALFCFSKDADNFEVSEPIRDAAVRLDRWEGEDEEEDVKVAC